MFVELIQKHTIMNTKSNELRSKPLALLTVQEFLELQQVEKIPQTQSIQISDIIGIDEAVLITGYRKNTIYSKTSQNTIPYHKRGNRVVFKRSELESWMLENRQETIEERIERFDQEILLKKKRKA